MDEYEAPTIDHLLYAATRGRIVPLGDLSLQGVAEMLATQLRPCEACFGTGHEFEPRDNPIPLLRVVLPTVMLESDRPCLRCNSLGISVFASWN